MLPAFNNGNEFGEHRVAVCARVRTCVHLPVRVRARVCLRTLSALSAYMAVHLSNPCACACACLACMLLICPNWLDSAHVFAYVLCVSDFNTKAAAIISTSGIIREAPPRSIQDSSEAREHNLWLLNVVLRNAQRMSHGQFPNGRSPSTLGARRSRGRNIHQCHGRTPMS